MSMYPHKKKEISGAHSSSSEDSAKYEMLIEKLRPRSSLKKSSLCWKAACWEEGWATVEMRERVGVLGRWRSVYMSVTSDGYKVARSCDGQIT